MNLITPANTKQAASLVKEGVTVSLERTVMTATGALGHAFRNGKMYNGIPSRCSGEPR